MLVKPCHDLHVLVENPSVVGQYDPPGAAVEEIDAVLFLKLANVHRDSRLRNVHGLSCLRNVSDFGNCKKLPKTSVHQASTIVIIYIN